MGRRRRRRRERAALVGVAAAALTLAWLLRAPSPARLAPLAVDLIRPPVVALPQNVPHDGPEVDLRLRVPPPRPRVRALPPPPPRGPPLVEPVLPLPAVPAPPPWTAPPRPSALSLSPWTPGLPDALPAPAPTAPPQRRHDPDAATRLLEDGLVVHDGQLGLAFPGARQIGAAIASSARLHAPPVSAARFVAHVGSDGRVSSLRYLSGDAGSEIGWAEVAAAAKLSLASAQLDLRGSLSGGALVTVDVTSNLELPSGAGRRRRPPRRRAQVRHMEKPTWPWAPRVGPRGSWREEGSWTSLSPDVSGFCAPPEATLPPCDPGDTLCPGGRFDVSDIGARPSRVVRTQVEVCPMRFQGGPRRLEGG